MEEKKYSILVVEDESAVSEALGDKFGREGFEVFLAKDGAKGLEVALREIPDLILLDIVMPVMDGITMLEKMRKDKKGKKIPVIMFTNLSDSDRIKEAQKKGVNDYLIKADWKLEDVVKKVKEKLDI
ncbi:MAG: response regulator [Candidatus Magasanikbacteria bacterium]|nr:response regulator [Candidatus Magasanikbacteria bacterium]MBT4315087.1 response regulator [Candidatus Magasanikbacteria bacterium]MBT4546997.1 response regulator [Candidatus Magasanikbacteria bacterium]MBT6818767.1 response regulator [Candidatus Magasanikbacteria bacterium]